MADAVTETKTRTGAVQSIERAFSLLESMADAGGTLGLSHWRTSPASHSPQSTDCCGRWSISATCARSHRANTFSGHA